jgi:hypothetical protein
MIMSEQLTNNIVYSDDSMSDTSWSYDEYNEDGEEANVMPLFRSLNLMEVSQQPALRVEFGVNATSRFESAKGFVSTSAVKGLKRPAVQPKVSASRLGGTTKKATTSRDAAYGWENNPTFKRVSPFQQTSKNCVSVMKRSNTTDEFLKTISEKLFGLFRQLSIQPVKFENTTPTCSVRCRSLDGIEFCICIWDDVHKNSYLIEIDQVSGDSTIFQGKYANVMLHSLAHVETPSVSGHDQAFCIESQNDNMDGKPMESSVTESLVSQMVMSSCIDVDTNTSLASALMVVTDLLATRCYEQCVKGMQILLQLVDSRLSGWIMAKSTASSIMLSSEYKVIRATVLHIACIPVDESQYRDETHQLLALSLLAQAIAMLESNEVVQFINMNTVVVDMLMRHVQHATTRTLVATYASRILAILLDRCHQVNLFQQQQYQLDSDVLGAYNFGFEHNSALASATRQLLLSLQ